MRQLALQQGRLEMMMRQADAPFEALSPAAWRLAARLLNHPPASLAQPACVEQADLLPLFGGDEELFNAAIDELLTTTLRFGEDDEPWETVHALEGVRFEPHNERMIVHYRFNPYFLRLLAAVTGGNPASPPVTGSRVGR